jgi:hypothetical protein
MEGNVMSNIDDVMNASTQSAQDVTRIEKLGGRVNEVPPASENGLAASQSVTARAKLSGFIAKPALSACRPPLFRR